MTEDAGFPSDPSYPYPQPTPLPDVPEPAPPEPPAPELPEPSAPEPPAPETPATAETPAPEPEPEPAAVPEVPGWLADIRQAIADSRILGEVGAAIEELYKLTTGG